MSTATAPAAPSIAGVFTSWTLQPVAVVLAVVAVAAYGRAVVRTVRWPAARTSCFGLGVALWLWTTCGWLEVYGHALFWVWTTQVLVLLLLVPVLVMGGQPVELARRRKARLGRLPDTAVGRLLSSPLVGPLLIPVLSAALVFGPVAGWSVSVPVAEWMVQLVTVVVGMAVALPLVTSTSRMSSLAVGLALGIGLFELLIDAVPGFALRLQTHITTSFFTERLAAGWSPRPIRDQQFAGAILWAVAETIDLPFLLLVFRQWLKADAREAQDVDTVLDAEAIARSSLDPAGSDGAPAVSAPWWLEDPRLRDRYH